MRIRNWLNNIEAQGKHVFPPISLYEKYVEDGYLTPPEPSLIALSDWNDPVAQRIGVVLRHRYGACLEWHDEWSACAHCAGIFRVVPRGGSWMPSFVIIDDEKVCMECARTMPDKVLAAYSGNHKKAIPAVCGIDPQQHGYKLLKEGMTNGLYENSDDDPAVLAEELRKLGIEDFIFTLEYSQPFEVTFNCYVSKGCQVPETINSKGVSVLDTFRNALQNLHESRAEAGPPPEPDCIMVQSIMRDGTIKSRYVSKQEFIEGIDL